MEKPFSFFLVTDTHYFDSSFKRTGEAYEKRSVTDQKCVAETPAIIDAGFEQIAQDKETDVILIPGDLVYRGEYQSHIGFRERLYKLKEQGKKIYLTHNKNVWLRYDAARGVIVANKPIVTAGDVTAFDTQAE